MQTIRHVIRDEQGLHARPAGMLVKEAVRFQSAITLVAEHAEADAKRIFSVMKLSIKQGGTLRVIIEGPDEEEAVAVLAAFLETHL